MHGSVITDKMVSTIITDNKTAKGLDLFFYQPGSNAQAMPQATCIHHGFARLPLEPMSRAAAVTGRFWSRDLEADGQPWLTMVARPMPGGPLIAHHERAWIVLAFGFILTAAVVTYIRSSAQP